MQMPKFPLECQLLPGEVPLSPNMTGDDDWEFETCRICGAEEKPAQAGLKFAAACTCAEKVHESCLAAAYDRRACPKCGSAGSSLPPGAVSEDQRGSCDISFKTRTVQPPAGGQEAPAAGGGQVPAAAGQEPQREAIVRLPVTPEQPDPVWQFRQVMSSLAGQFDNPHPPTLYEMVEGGDCRFEMFDARTGETRPLQAHEVPAALREVFKRDGPQ